MDNDEFLRKLQGEIERATRGLSANPQIDPALENQMLDWMKTNEEQMKGADLATQLANLEQLKQDTAKLKTVVENMLGVETLDPTAGAPKATGSEPRFELKWPLDPRLPLFLPFGQMDRETQLSVLSAEWSRRRKEGHAAMYAGQLDEAEATFRECLERAEQLGAPDLKVASCECLISLAKQRGDREAERHWLDAATKAGQAP